MTPNQLDKVIGPHPDVDYEVRFMHGWPPLCESCAEFLAIVTVYWEPSETSVGCRDVCVACVRSTVDFATESADEGSRIVVEILQHVAVGKAVA